MTYKTIALELIQDRPTLYAQLQSTKRLLPSMEAYAMELKALHDAWKSWIGRERPNSNPQQVASDALERAIEELQERLPSESPKDAEPLSLDAAMSFVKRHTPPA